MCRTFHKDWPALIYASVDREHNKFVVSIVNDEHNHPTTEDNFKRYPEQRKLNADAKADAETMLNLGIPVNLFEWV